MAVTGKSIKPGRVNDKQICKIIIETLEELEPNTVIAPITNVKKLLHKVNKYVKDLDGLLNRDRTLFEDMRYNQMYRGISKYMYTARGHKKGPYQDNRLSEFMELVESYKEKSTVEPGISISPLVARVFTFTILEKVVVNIPEFNEELLQLKNL